MWERPEAVLFDLFGTLTRGFSSEAYIRNVSRMAAVLDAPVDEFVQAWRGRASTRMTIGSVRTEQNIRATCEAIGVSPTDDAIAEATVVRITFTRDTLAPRPDALDTLRSLRETGIRLALVSDCSPEVPHLWGELPYAPLIDVPVFSCDVGARKPDERMYRAALDGLPADPSRCVYVGDGGGRELSGATAMGMRAIMIRDAGETDVFRIDAEDWEGERVHSLAEVLGLLGLA